MERTQQPLSVGQKKNKTQAQAKQSAVPTAPHKDQRSKRSKKMQPQSAQAPAQAGMTQPRPHTGLQPMSAQQAAAPAMASTPVAQQPRMTMSKTKKTVKKAAANHILVVAHPSAQAQQVFDLLKAAGVQEALPSRREQLSAQALTETLLKAHGLQWSNGQVPTSIESVEASPMWQSLVLDLVLGNMDQPLWAWLDPQAVHLLDFWQQQSEHTVFMLVYDDIHNIYQQCLQSGAEASPESINAKVQSWVAYNEALLQFHLRNPERSFLVHAKQVAQSAQSYVQQINQRVAAPLQLAVGHSTASEQPVDTAEQPTSQLASTELQTQPSTAAQPSTDGLANWLIEQLVNTQSDALQLYEALQAAANLPLANVAMSAPAADAAALQQAWASFIAAQQQHSHNTQRVADLQQQLQTLQQQHAQVQALTHSEAAAKQALQVQLKNAEEENALLLEQLHKVQEKLEELYLQGKEDKENQESLAAQTKKIKEQLLAENSKTKQLQAHLSAEQQIAKKYKDHLAVEQEKNKALQERLARLKLDTSLDNSVSHLKKENELLIEKYHFLQEKLLKRISLGNILEKENNFFINDEKNTTSLYYGAGERIKESVEYKIGHLMVTKSNSFFGIFSLPFLIASEIKKHKSDIEEKGLPPLEEYYDFYEAEKVKKHLSYRLGKKFINGKKNAFGVFSLPWALYREVVSFRKDRVKSLDK